LVKKLPFKIKLLIFYYLKVKNVPTKMTLQHATIAEKIPVLIKVVFLFKIFCGIFIFERCISKPSIHLAEKLSNYY
tara:strand:+ start:264 stop:491 length:228 start_codon:yes stop_codon:yes gene_type:complete